MLSEDDRRRIEAEEVQAAQAEAGRAAALRRERLAGTYRREVREALRPRPWWWPARWAFLFVPLGAAAGLWLRPQVPPADDALGGVRTSALVEQCSEEVARLTYGREADLRFPSPREVGDSVQADADGKRWEGWASRPDGSRLTFACTYTAADRSVRADLLEERP